MVAPAESLQPPNVERLAKPPRGRSIPQPVGFLSYGWPAASGAIHPLRSYTVTVVHPGQVARAPCGATRKLPSGDGPPSRRRQGHEPVYLSMLGLNPSAGPAESAGGRAIRLDRPH